MGRTRTVWFWSLLSAAAAGGLGVAVNIATDQKTNPLAWIIVIAFIVAGGGVSAGSQLLRQRENSRGSSTSARPGVGHIKVDNSDTRRTDVVFNVNSGSGDGGTIQARDVHGGIHFSRVNAWVVLLVFLVSCALIGATLMGVNLAGPRVDDTSRQSPATEGPAQTAPSSQPQMLDVARPSYEQGSRQGFSYAFAHPPNLSPQDLAEANKLQGGWKGLFAWVQPRHGVVVNEADIEVTINNPRMNTATINDIELADKQCQAPLSGGLLYHPPAGSGPDVQMLFDLDAADTEPHSYQYGTDSGPYFIGPNAQHLTVVHNTPQVILLDVVTLKYDCQFRFKIDVTAADGVKSSYIISDDGKPFEVTAIPKNVTTGIEDYTGYKEMWAGGVASPNDTGPTPNTNFVAVNPKTYPN